MSNNSAGSVLQALLVGAAIGAGVGILYAPDKGSKTRKRIKKTLAEAQHDLSRQLEQVSDELSLVSRERKKEFEEQLDETLSIMNDKAGDLIEALERKLAELKAQNTQLQNDIRPEPDKS